MFVRRKSLLFSHHSPLCISITAVGLYPFSEQADVTSWGEKKSNYCVQMATFTARLSGQRLLSVDISHVAFKVNQPETPDSQSKD
jgi:hypothetical protein